MAFSDYSTTPSLNTTVAGQNIAPGGPPSAVGPVLRQYASDGATLAKQVGDFAVSAGTFVEWTTNPAEAIRLAIATGKDVYIPAIGTISIPTTLGTTKPNQRVFGRGKGLTVLRKDFAGDLITLDLGSSITDLTIDGNGSSFSTGRGVVITAGTNGTGFQRVDRVSIRNTGGYCVEWTQNASGWGGGMTDCDVRRYGDSAPCLKMPSVETNGNRILTNVFAGSGTLIDFAGCANVQLIACTSGSAAGPTPGWLITKSSAKVQIIGGRYATGGGTTIFLGVNHTMTGASHAGPFVLGDTSVNSFANSKGAANDFAGYSVTDLSSTDTASVNAFDIPLMTLTPAWTATTAPNLGNGLLSAAFSRSGGHVTIDCDLEFGSGTTAGTGAWSFSTPLKNFGRRAVGAAWMFDTSAGTPVFVGVAVIESGQSTIQIYPHQNNVAQSNSPFTWATGDKLSFTVTYLAG